VVQEWGKAHNSDHSQSMLERLCLDRRLVNLLTACRLYLDQTDHGISILFGKNSSELKDVKTFKNDLYDKHWGYRLMEALRNHAQHSGLPIHVIGYPMYLSQGKGPDYKEFTISPKTEVSRLIENSRLKKPIVNELESKGDTIDLRGPTREYLSCFVQLHDKLREMIQSRVENAQELYKRAVDEFGLINGQKVKFASLRELHDDQKTQGEVALVTHFFDYYDVLRKRNVVNKYLKLSMASNTDQKKVYNRYCSMPQKILSDELPGITRTP